MIKKIIINIIILIGMGTPVFSQLKPLYDQYILNGMSVNPAFAGSQEALSIGLLARNQWVGFEGAPKTVTLSLHTPLRDERVNLGLLLFSDKTGSRSETGLMLNYAYRIYFKGGKLSFGLAAGFTGLSTDREMLRYTDPGDELILNPGTRAILPEMSFGIYYYSDRFYAGFSVPYFLNHKLDESSGKYGLAVNPTRMTYMLLSGYKFPLSEKYQFIPSVLIKTDSFKRMQVDLNGNLVYREKIWLGAGYRSDNSMLYMLQYQVNNQFRVAYTYGYEFSELSHYQKGTHEIMLLYIFKYMVDVRSPRYF